MNTVVVYKSQTGFTKKYAQWIAEDLGCDILSVKKATEESLKPYGVVVYGGGIIAGQIGGWKKFKGVIESFAEKKWVVFATGATPVEEKKAMEQIINGNFTAQEKDKILYFYLQSGVNYENMNMGSKMLMKMLNSILAKKKDKTPEEQGMSDMIKHSCDLSKREYIVPLVTHVRSM